jgi:hypothetical protein
MSMCLNWQLNSSGKAQPNNGMYPTAIPCGFHARDSLQFGGSSRRVMPVVRAPERNEL